MSYAQSYAANVQEIAIAGADGMSGDARRAEGALRQVHRDLPEMVKFTTEMLSHSGIDVGASRATSHRLAESLMREIAVAPQGVLTGVDKGNVERAALRSVLVQEAAAHRYEQRTGRPETFRQFVGDDRQVNGAQALATLERQKVDTYALFSKATDSELTQMAVGAFDRTSVEQQQRSARALEVPMERIEQHSAVAPVQTARPLPVRGNIVHRAGQDARRSPSTFGRRMNPAPALAAAGRGV